MFALAFLARLHKTQKREGDITGHVLRALAKDYISKASREETPTRFDLLIVDLKQATGGLSTMTTRNRTLVVGTRIERELIG